MDIETTQKFFLGKSRDIYVGKLLDYHLIIAQII